MNQHGVGAELHKGGTYGCLMLVRAKAGPLHVGSKYVNTRILYCTLETKTGPA